MIGQFCEPYSTVRPAELEYLTNLDFSVRTVSYGFSFFSVDLWPKREVNGKKLGLSLTVRTSNPVSKRDDGPVSQLFTIDPVGQLKNHALPVLSRPVHKLNASDRLRIDHTTNSPKIT